MQGHAIDNRSDLYSLGVTYYHMLAGAPPFRYTRWPSHLSTCERRPSILVYRPDLPIELDRLVLKLMEKDPDDRYQSAADMLADLNKIRETLSLGSVTTLGDRPIDCLASR